MSTPVVIERISQMQAESRLARARAETIGLVPTMGALHDGHLSLVQEARRLVDRVVVSIFVNPTQFAPGEDFDAYRRDLSADLETLGPAGVDVVFAPTVAEMYPSGFQTYVQVTDISRELEGALRPTHFRGVATVVNKLFQVAAPHVAVFGEKDYQQLLLIRRMVHDLAIDVEIVGAPIRRDHDGLALSSRNAYLSPGERAQATCLSRALFRAESLWREGERRQEKLIAEMRQVIEREEAAKIDYVELRHAANLGSLGETAHGPVVCLLAVRIGRTRLIDNRVLR